MITPEAQAALERLRSNSYPVIHGRLGTRLTIDGRTQREEDLEMVKDFALAEHSESREAEQRECLASLKRNLGFTAILDAGLVSIEPQLVRRIIALLGGLTNE